MFDYWSRKLWDGRRSLELLVSEQHELDQQERKMLFKNNVEVINLELSKHCNRKCNYCPVAHSSRNSDQEIIDEPLFNSIVDDLARIGFSGTLSLNLYNEPLLNPELMSQIRHIRQSLPKAFISFNSNGDSLNASLLASLSKAGLNFICVTLHPKPDTVISEKETVKRTTTLLRKIGTDSIDELDVPTIVKNSTHLAVSVNGVAVRIQWPDWNLLGGSRGGEIAVLDIGKPVRKQPCVRPFREFTLYYDGTVTPCCEVFYDGESDSLVTGRVDPTNGMDIFSVYASSRMSSFRRSVFDYSDKLGVCKFCPVADYAVDQDTNTRSTILAATRLQEVSQVANG